eukprot:12148174-Ditylum_brightwellii.AAC.1
MRTVVEYRHCMKVVILPLVMAAVFLEIQAVRGFVPPLVMAALFLVVKMARLSAPPLVQAAM